MSLRRAYPGWRAPMRARAGFDPPDDDQSVNITCSACGLQMDMPGPCHPSWPAPRATSPKNSAYSTPYLPQQPPKPEPAHMRAIPSGTNQAWTARKIGVPRSLPVPDVLARSLAVAMAGQARSSRGVSFGMMLTIVPLAGGTAPLCDRL